MKLFSKTKSELIIVFKKFVLKKNDNNNIKAQN